VGLNGTAPYRRAADSTRLSSTVC